MNDAYYNYKHSNALWANDEKGYKKVKYDTINT